MFSVSKEEDYKKRQFSAENSVAVFGFFFGATRYKRTDIYMGTLAKRLQQIASRSLESESSNIIKTVAANKHGLSKALDTTLRTSHDMKVFGLGTAASMSSLERYARFTTSMHAVYSTMERNLDASPSKANASVWHPFGEALRRAPSLQTDLDEAIALAPLDDPPARTPATDAYVAAIDAAAQADAANGGARLIGHLYCRYFADLFGGQALAGPYRWALDLGSDSPRHYDFGEFGTKRRESVQAIYAAINEAGDALESDAQREAVVEEARVAFRHNVHVYSEEGKLYTDGALGLAKMAAGFGRSRMNARA